MITTTRKRKNPRALFTPQVKEMIKAIKQAACDTYEISEDDLLNEGSYTVAALRFYCYWLLWKNAGLKDYAIAEAFGKSRNAVCYGLDQIESQRNVYREVTSALKTIAAQANQYPKKFDWCIQ
jgi:chromosomal replication initiation ATPase DnaA